MTTATQRKPRKQSKPRKPLGIVLWRGASYLTGQPVVAIATLKTTNRKTGDMVQVWILPDETANPLEVLQQGRNGGACGDCPLQGTPVADAKGRIKLVNRVCYVNVGQAPHAIHKAYQAGKYAEYDPATHDDMLRGSAIRLGAYGDPMAMPISLCEHLVSLSRKHTGYTHQLFRLGLDPQVAARFARILMVSAHNKAIDAEAKRRGWRRFTVVESHEQAPQGSLECPAYSHNLTCEQCGLCNGSKGGGRSIYALAHGMSGRNLSKHAE